MKLHMFFGNGCEGFEAGARALGVLADEGYPVSVLCRDEMRIFADKDGAEILCANKAQFFRLLGRLLAGDTDICEAPVFERCGAMLDVSRNAVLKVDSVKAFIRRMALMGMNVLMLYTEDTYEVPGRPYFGLQRGAYTQKELREIDDYADMFGIEVVPCIQTLGHLEKVLRHPGFEDVRDTPDIMMVGDAGALKVLRDMIAAATAPFRSRRIHLGMDEAHALGLGRYLEKNGYRPNLDLMREHLHDLTAICREMGLTPMIWSDMCLRMLSPARDYYDVSGDVPRDVADAVPDELSLVYWDYYHEDAGTYADQLRRHMSFSNPVIFAGGAWTWNGVAPNVGKAFATTRAALPMCRAAGVREIVCTCWGDNGAETPLETALPTLQLFAEYAYGAPTDDESLFERFRACCGGSYDDFLALRYFDEVPGVRENNPGFANPSKWLLYSDVLLGTFDRHIENWDPAAHYRDMEALCRKAARRSPGYQGLFDHYARLAALLAVKGDLSVALREHCLARDTGALREDVVRIDDAIEKANALLESFRAWWYASCKPQGFEVIDVRVSSVAARLKSARHRVTDFIEGRIDRIEEAEAPRLPVDGGNGGPDLSVNLWHRIIGNCPIETV